MATRCVALVAAVASVGLAGCSGSGGGAGDTGASPTPGGRPTPSTTGHSRASVGKPIRPVPAPTYHPADFVARVDNPYFPLAPGSRYVYRGVEDGDHTRDVVTVTHRTKRIDGVPCVVVHDFVYTNGRLTEPTTDWYAQDVAGNVWYFGEATAELDRSGHVTSRAGSWRAGRDGATAGIYMPSGPAVGQEFQQEYYPREAVDRFRVIALHRPVRTPRTGPRTALLTEEWTPLEPRIYEHKWYVRGIGNVRVEVVRGGQETQTLVSYRRA